MITSAKISQMIEELCAKNGIEYCSKNPDKIKVCEDAKKLGQYCQTILELVDEVSKILDAHKINTEFKKRINKEIEELSNLKHDLINLAQCIIIEERQK